MTTLSICVYVRWCWRSYVLKASRRAGVGEQPPAHTRLLFLRSSNIGRPGRIKLSRACSLRCKVTAFLHCYTHFVMKKVFSQSMFWSSSWLSCDRRDLFVAGRGFSGFSCSAGVRAVVPFKRCLMPYCPRTLHHGCFASFLTERWLTGTSVYWLSSVKIC